MIQQKIDDRDIAAYIKRAIYLLNQDSHVDHIYPNKVLLKTALDRIKEKHQEQQYSHKNVTIVDTLSFVREIIVYNPQSMDFSDVLLQIDEYCDRNVYADCTNVLLINFLGEVERIHVRIADNYQNLLELSLDILLRCLVNVLIPNSFFLTRQKPLP